MYVCVRGIPRCGGEDTCLCMHSQLSAWWWKGTHARVYVRDSPHVGVDTARVSVRGFHRGEVKDAGVCVRGSPRVKGRKRMCLYAFVAPPMLRDGGGTCKYASVASPVVRGEDTCTCMRSRPLLWWERDRLCICICVHDSYRGGGDTTHACVHHTFADSLIMVLKDISVCTH